MITLLSSLLTMFLLQVPAAIPTPTVGPSTSARIIPVASMPAASMREDPTGVSVLKASKATQTSNVEVRKLINPCEIFSFYNFGMIG